MKKISKRVKGLLNTKHIECDARELFFQENKEDFNRFDIIVRYLAIENYYNKNDYGFDLYRKMQGARVNQEWIDRSTDLYKELIESFDKKGYDFTSIIEIDKNLNLIDGSHRIALALYHNINIISCKVRPYPVNIFYGIEWFIEHGFTSDEISILINKYKKLKAKTIQPFPCILWPPVQDHFDNIVNKLSYIGEVISYQDYIFDDYTFASFVRGAYAIDDIAKWKIEMKIEKMSNSNTKKVRLVLLNIEKPKFRLKASNNNTLSTTGERIKKMIRNAYKNKVDNYFHDIIIHIGDNYNQNAFIQHLFNVKINVKEVLDEITDYNYVVSKLEVPYMPSDFPLNFPLNKDIDILCSKTDYSNIVEQIEEKTKLLNNDNGLKIRIIKKHTAKKIEYRTLIRIELDTFLILQFDISYTLDHTKNNFIEELIKAKTTNRSINVPSMHYEYIIRLIETFVNPTKVHHVNYLHEHKADLDAELCNRYLNFDWEKVHNKNV